MREPKKLIEVAMPIKEISAESVRDKSIRHGHISTLHLWWARRPLPVCRAVVFASLVPDPLDENCPNQFKDAVELLLGGNNNLGDPYKPYIDIPWTSVYDPMEDNLRNRLQMFIGKFTDEMQQHLLNHKSKPAADNIISNFSLIKWDNKNNEAIINKARKLIWVAHNSSKLNCTKTALDLLNDFEGYYNNIKKAENELYDLLDRNNESSKSIELNNRLQEVIDLFLEKMPKVFDPFAGGGAIPLEASRLGCRTFGNDINPVAHIIQKGSLEFPQKFGKPISYSKKNFIELYGEYYFYDYPNENKTFSNGEAIAISIKNRLSFDVEFYSKKLLAEVEQEIGHLYPKDENGKRPMAYYWAYEGICSNPSCKAKVPLIKQFYIVNKPEKKIHLKPIIEGKNIRFELKSGSISEEAWIQRKNLKCPICGNITNVNELKRQFNSKESKKAIIAVVEDGVNTKNYRQPNKNEIDILNTIPTNIEKPMEKMPIGNSRDLHCMGWGVEYWADMFSERQLVLMNALVNKINDFKNGILQLHNEDYINCISVYLAIFIDRIAAANTSFGRWNVARETLETPFSRQAIPFMVDFPESVPFSHSTGSALNQLNWITRYIESESNFPFQTTLNNAASGDESQFAPKYLDAVITDPPYYDAIAYADLSDFFYTWLKRMVGDIFHLNFAVPQTPKSDECTALKHHHNGSMEKAKLHFENKLMEIFSAIEKQTKDVVSIMFAHQSTEAWTTLCNSILGSKMNITGSWPIDTEMGARMVAMDNAALQSSVTVAARPSHRQNVSSYREVKRAIEITVANEVEKLYRLGFRGADLLTACFGQAVSEFGRFEKLEKADGSEVSVAELLELARESAFNALLKGFSGDEFTKFYIGWLQLHGFIESDFDDAAKFTKIGLSINVQDLFKEHILVKNDNKQRLSTMHERIQVNQKIGEHKNSFLIDVSHKLMFLYKSPNRNSLLKFIENNQLDADSPVWRVITSLAELLPKEIEDHKLVVGLLTNKDQLIREAKSSNTPKPEQSKLTFE